MYWEFVYTRKNTGIIKSFFLPYRSFNFEDVRIDEALRSFLEAFRLPGEAPVISYLMEHFAEHWHVSLLSIVSRVGKNSEFFHLIQIR